MTFRFVYWAFKIQRTRCMMCRHFDAKLHYCQRNVSSFQRNTVLHQANKVCSHEQGTVASLLNNQQHILLLNPLLSAQLLFILSTKHPQSGYQSMEQTLTDHLWWSCYQGINQVHHRLTVIWLFVLNCVCKLMCFRLVWSLSASFLVALFKKVKRPSMEVNKGNLVPTRLFSYEDSKILQSKLLWEMEVYRYIGIYLCLLGSSVENSESLCHSVPLLMLLITAYCPWIISIVKIARVIAWI